jgi:RNA polymerase sigma-70 factor (ECF subfamily)
MTAGAAESVFEAQRGSLLALAYQMLGELGAAEDIVQEAWIRWNAAQQSDIRSPRAWLTSVVTRLSVDYLRSARVRRESYTGPWLPEPILENEATPPGMLELAQRCELALLWSLERLTEEERAAFLLRQVFDTDYADIAAMLQRSEAACRQLVSRASRRVRDEGPRYTASQERLEQVMVQFAQAAAAGDKETVLSLLAPDVVSVSDGGGVVRAALIPLEGPERVAQVMTHIASKAAAEAAVSGAPSIPELVRANGRPAFVQWAGEGMIFTLRLNEQGQVAWIYTLRNPHKLALVAQR